MVGRWVELGTGVARARRGLSDRRSDRTGRSLRSGRCAVDQLSLAACESLRADGLRLTYLPVDGHGRVEPADLRAAISSDTALVSVMVGNAEHILTTVTTPELR